MSIVICTDLDGTLLDEHGCIHPKDKEILETRQDLQFVLATGRPLHSVKRAFLKNGMFLDRSIPFSQVLVNGSVTYRPGEALRDYFPFTPSLAEQLINLTHDYPQMTDWLYSIDDVYVRWPNEFSQGVLERLDMCSLPYLDQHPYPKFSKLVCVSGEPALLHEVGQRASHLPVEVSYGLGLLFEVTPKGVNKGNGVLSVLPPLRNGTRIYTAGDDENDLPLFKLADRSFCPTTANPLLLPSVDQVVDKAEKGLLLPILEHAGVA
jgi:HAD superfamily hydrolase (TIGR01484 family)